jgi:hypothetical protein
MSRWLVAVLLLAGCAAPTPDAPLWQPAPGTTWQWQLSGPIDTTVDAAVYDVDGVETTAAQVQALHAAGRKVICYVDAGGYENYRPDASSFPKSVLGNSNNWPGQQWLDIRQINILKPIMAARFTTCQQKGFDAIEADEVDGYTNDTGFPLTAADQLTYNTMLAQLAHQRGLSIGLKNDLDQIPQLVNDFQFAIDEQCFQYQECDQLQPFVQADKAVFEAEYQPGQFCAQAKSMGLSTIRKNLALDAPRWPC